ncbi:MAG: hypothetical protein WDZ59_06640 [Pirellulales bacterium]
MNRNRLSMGSALAVCGLALLLAPLSHAQPPEGRAPQGDRPGGGPNPERIFERLDTNDDGALSKEEFSALAQRMRSGGGQFLGGPRGFRGVPPRDGDRRGADRGPERRDRNGDDDDRDDGARDDDDDRDDDDREDGARDDDDDRDDSDRGFARRGGGGRRGGPAFAQRGRGFGPGPGFGAPRGGRPGPAGPGFGGPRGGAGTLPPARIAMAVDADRNGEISAGEIEGAAAALKQLDRNGDGKLTAPELRPGPRVDRDGPPRRDGNFRRGLGGRPGDGPPRRGRIDGDDRNGPPQPDRDRGDSDDDEEEDVEVEDDDEENDD